MKLTIVRTDKKKIQHLTVKSVEWFLERIKTDTKAEDIGKLREYIARFGDDGNYEGNAPIAMIYPSVEMAKAENGNLEIVGFNNLICLHIAGLMTQNDIKEVKEASKILPTTYAAFTGSDGKSVEVLVSVAQKDTESKPQTEQEMDAFCAAAYEVAFGAYGGLLPKPIERQSAKARSCFRMTLDSEPYYNPQVTPMMIQRGFAGELASKLCEMDVPEEEAFLHIRNHHIYKKIFDEAKARAIVSAVYSEEKPKRRKEGEMTSVETRRLIEFLTTRYVFRYNQVMGYTEYRPNNTWVQDWTPCDENVINGMTIEARLSNLDVKDKDIRRYVHSNMIRKIDPITDYLLKCYDEWDGETDHIAMLARCVPCNIPQWEKWFKKWFLYMVAQWVMPQKEYGNSIVPLLISPQGDGKTKYCRMILPDELQWGFLENLDVSEKRNTLQSMHNFLLINLDEFNSISTKLQEGFLKNVIQLPNVKIKRPYGKHVEEFRRYASFIATTNETNVLSDPTGSRRFICVNLTAPINTDYKPNYKALYGQAYRMVMNRDMEWWFNASEVKEIMEHNRQFQLTPAAIQYFDEYFEVVNDENKGEWMSPTAIYDELRKIAGSGLKANGVLTFGRYLSNMPDIRMKRTRKGKIYLVKRKEK